MKRIPLLWKITLGTFSVIFITTGIFSFYGFKTIVNAVSHEIINKLEALSLALSLGLGSGTYDLNWAFATKIVEEIKEEEDIEYCMVVKPDGTVYFSSDMDIWGQVIKDKAIKGKRTTIRDEIYKGKPIKTVIKPISFIGGETWTVWLGFSLERIAILRKRFFWGILGMVLLFLAFGYSISFFIAKRITHPIKILVSGTKKVAKGNLSYQVKVDSKDELGELSISFNKMIDNLKKITVSKNYVNNIIDSMIDTLVVVDSHEKIQVVNRATEELLGYKKEELIGKPIDTILGEKTPIFKWTREGEILRKGHLKDYELTYLTKNNEKIPVIFSGSIMKSPDGRLTEIVGVARDMREIKKLITDLRETQKELEKSYQELQQTHSQLIQSEKLRAIGKLLAGIVHEIDNPLSIISGHIQILLRRNDITPEIKKSLETVIKQVNRVSTTASRLLQFSKKSKYEIKMKEVNINKCIEETLELLEYQLSLNNIKTIKKLSSTLPLISGDSVQLQQVFFNLITNASQAMPKGGKLTITTGVRDNWVEIKFIDTGCGIPKKNLDKLFEPFFTTSTEKGVGLGLSIVRQIIDAHKGSIEVESEEEKGSTFVVKLPIKKKGY